MIDPGHAGALNALTAFPLRQAPVGISEMPPLVVEPTTEQQIARRAIDLTIAVVALAIFAIPMLIIALIVKLTSPGPALFTQERAGAGGENFTILKFRTMTPDTAASLNSSPDQLQAFIANDFKLAGDDLRITTVGKFLRRTSLDELPQLINVVLGQMSIVGIRPLFPEQLAQRSAYDQALYGHMRPGLTGRWQVAGRSNIRDDERIMLDREYVEGWSVSADLRLIVQTPRALLMPGAAR
jgi:lipopolysaccharide/colanic/teichoic acid biosynthesis glycosyltransferase